MAETVSVLNGDVQVGDTIAYPVRFGSSMDTKIAEVLAIEWREHSWKRDTQVPALKVKVTKASFSFAGVPYKTTITELDRVVKLG